MTYPSFTSCFPKITESDPQMQQPIQPTRMCISQLTLPYRVPWDIDLGFFSRFVAAVVGGCFLASPKNSSMASSNGSIRNLPKSHKISRDLCYVRLRGWMFCHPSCRIFGEVSCSCLGATQCKIIWSYNSGHVSNQRCRYTDTISVHVWSFPCFEKNRFEDPSIWDASPSIKSAKKPISFSKCNDNSQCPGVVTRWVTRWNLELVEKYRGLTA